MNRQGILIRVVGLLRKHVPPVLFICLVPLILLAFLHIGIIDDAYISYRYAHNLVEGYGLVFNPGERVEGFSNLLWTLIMAVPEALGFPVHIFAALLGVGFGLLALIDTWRLCNRLSVPFWGAAAATITLGLYPDFWLTMANGLEGGLFVFLLMRSVYLVVSGRSAYAGLFCGLLFMTRPDALLVGAICALYALVAPENQPLPVQQRITRRVLPLLAPWLTLVAVVTIWRLAYYGSWLPNTITAKSVPLTVYTLAGNIYSGINYWFGFMLSAAPLTVGAALALIAAARCPAVWLCLAIVAAQLPVVLINGGDWMPYYRLLVVYAPLLAVLLGIAVKLIASYGPRLSGVLPLRSTTGLGAGLFLLAMVVMLLHTDAPKGIPQWDATPDIAIGKPEPCYRVVADATRSALLPGDRVSLEAGGVASYMLPNVYSNEMFGLTDRYVAHHGIVYVRAMGKLAPAYLYYTIRPNLIVVHTKFIFLSRIAHASDGAHNDNYSTYSLPELNCPTYNYPLLISIRKDSVAHILPALAELKPQPVQVPSQIREKRSSLWHKVLESLGLAKK
jgi:hypothetical protein